MAKGQKSTDAGDKGLKPGTPRAEGGASTVEIATAGIRTGQDFANLMSALMADVLAGRVSPATANAACNAGGKLLKVVEMQYRYGKAQPIEAQNPYLELAPPAKQ